MKFIYIANARMPTDKAHGIQIVKMCESFAMCGMEVELIAPKRINPIKEDVFSFYGIKKNFKIKKIYSLDLLGIKTISRIAVHIQAFTFALSVFFYISLNRKSFKRDDVFYFRDEFSPWLLSLLNKNIFLEIHAFSKRFKYYRKLFSKSKGLILITENSKKEFIGLGIKKEKILVAPDGVDLAKFNLDLIIEEARKKLNLPNDKKMIGYTGSFTTMGMDKGINDILKALTMIDESITFIAIGGSEKDISYYTEKANKLNIKNRIMFVKHVNQSDLAIYQKACDILLMPFPNIEHYAYYMSPLKMFEYMASGRPIIATDLPSVREVLNNPRSGPGQDNAVLVKPDNPEDLAKAIEAVLANKLFVKQITQQAWQDVREFTWEKRAEKIIKFIKQKI